ncbi:multicopper oxidase domain-containing protein [Legionella adelaidensis]|nr:multicopper oxidase domain-containing protein [Legionella adelaidensis]
MAQHEHHIHQMTPAPVTTPKPKSEQVKKAKRKTNSQFSRKVSAMRGREQVINLVIAYKTVNYGGKPRRAIAINNQIPGPTLHFKEGDHVTINVYNQLDKGTSLHWHGILVPWQMDGVENVSQKAIPPGGVFHYRFTLYQAGTYWYHAHADVQEQEGVYGAFLVESLDKTPYHYTKDYVIVLSDWSNSPAEQVFSNLKKEGDYYSPLFPLQPSLSKFIHDYHKADSIERKKLIDDYKMMQQMRMSIYDLSDVAYDAYLLNGKTKNFPWSAPVKVGDVVRLRFIGAAGSTIYQVKIPNAQMEMVHIQGNDVRPYAVENFSIAPGETEDILVKIEKDRPYIIYAESIDTRGVAIGALLTKPGQNINYQQIAPFPEPKPVTRDMMAHMGMQMHSQAPSNMQMHAHHKTRKIKQESTESKKNAMAMNHTMEMPTEPSIVGDTIEPFYPDSAVMTHGTKYQNLIAAVPTNDPDKPVDGIIKMELFGYMDRFIWMINGLPEYKAKPILIEPGKRYRIIFTNNSMMRHPMHIHGHWFILRNGNNAHDPLLHTIEVPPGATAVADFDSDASGQWFFHCHHIYHMMAGMARVFQYETIIDVIQGRRNPEKEISTGNYINRPIIRVDEQVPIDDSLVLHPQGHHAGFYFASFLDIGTDLFSNTQRLTYKGLYGPDYNKIELFTNDAELSNGSIENADIDIFYWHLISQFWAVKGGVNYFYRPATEPYWQPGVGIEGLMPYFIALDARGYLYNGSAKLDLEISRDTQLTNNFFLKLGVRPIIASKTVKQAAIGNGLNQMRYVITPYYRLTPGVNINLEFEHEKAFGAYKTLLRNLNQATTENTLTIGFSFVI